MDYTGQKSYILIKWQDNRWIRTGPKYYTLSEAQLEKTTEDRIVHFLMVEDLNTFSFEELDGCL